MGMKKIWKVLFNALERILLIVAVVGGVGIILPRAFHIVPYIVLSGSMEPEIQAGSIVYIDKNIEIEEIQEKDIIGYCMNNEVKVVHRIVQLDRENHMVVTKGDANQVEDITPVPFERIEGKVIVSVPYIGYGVAWIRSMMGITVIIFITTVLFLGTILKRI
ncbi:Signal peptidase I W [Clostridiales bacterium CHKCI001]|nr:Signal peptidase I W [Clostridiales bacterium CHKCI001]